MESLQTAFARLRADSTMRGMWQTMCAWEGGTAAEILEGDQIRIYTFTDYRRWSVAAAARLRLAIGEKNIGRFVGLRMENCPTWPALFFGLLIAGYKPVLLDNRGSVAQAAGILSQTDAAAVCAGDPGFTVDVCPVVQVSPLMEAAWQDGRVDFSSAWQDEVALCTSGTTGNPKIFIFKGANIIADLENGLNLPKETNILYEHEPLKSLAFLPLHHVFGLIGTMLWYIVLGRTVVFLSDKTPEGMLHACRVHEVTHIYAVPMFWNSIAKAVRRKAALAGPEREAQLQTAIKRGMDLQNKWGRKGRKLAQKLFLGKVQDSLFGRSIRVMISGGGYIPPDTLALFNGLGYPLINGYGLTECAIVAIEMSMRPEIILQGAAGRPLSNVDFKLLPVPGNKQPNVGELLVRTPCMHTDCIRDGVRVGRQVDAQGFFHTGDMARLDAAGNMTLVGRLKEVIIGESGENVYPDELEERFFELSGAQNICILGLPKPGSQYEEILLVVDVNTPLSQQDVADMAADFAARNAKLPAYTKVSRLVIAAEDLPMANGIKVQRQKITDALAANKFPYDEVDVRGGCLKQAAAATARDRQLQQILSSQDFINVRDVIRGFFAEALSLPAADIGDTSLFVQELGGDSLSSLSIFSKCEERFGIMLSDDDYYGCETLNDVSLLVYRKLHGAPLADAQGDQKRTPIVRFEDTPEWQAFSQRLKKAESEGNPYFVPHDSPLLDTSIYRGREVINFGSYNYLGMSGNPETKAAAKAAIDQYGTSASGSRLLAGEKPIHQQLESAIAAWKHAENALVLVGGHSTNVTFVGNFCGRHDLILYDALSHDSIQQGCRLSVSDTKAFPHNDLAALESLLSHSRDKYEKVLIIVEGVYSMDGDIAPIPEFVAIKKKYGCFLMVDEAHSVGVIGEDGGGVDDYFHLASDDIDIKMGTLSKTLGACGGYLAGKHALIEYQRYNVPGFMFSVGISPPLAAAVTKAIEILQRDNTRVQKLQANIAEFVSVAHQKGFDTCLAGESAIIPVLIRDDDTAFALSQALLLQDVFVPPAVYPAVPQNQARLRFCVNSEHSFNQIHYALDALEQLMQQHGIPMGGVAKTV